MLKVDLFAVLKRVKYPLFHFSKESLYNTIAYVTLGSTGYRSCDGVREYKVSEILQEMIPKKVEMDAKEKDEKLFDSNVEQKYNKEMEISEKAF